MPVFNQEDRIGAAIAGLSQLCRDQNISHEVLVVDNGSVDNTGALLALLRRSMPGLRTCDLPKKTGRAHALREGMQRAQGRFVLLAGASEALRALSHQPGEAISRALRLLEEGYEVIITETSESESNLRGLGAALFSRMKRGLHSFLGNEDEAPLLFFERRRGLELALGLQDPEHGEAELLSLARARRHRIVELLRPR
jgi:dolichol-phosphate mannosyltransferase